MTDWFTETVSAPKTAPAASSGTDWTGQILGTGEMRAAPEGTKFGTQKGLVDDPNRAVPLFTLIKAGAFPDETKQIKFLAQETGIPETRWGVIDGNIVYSDDKTGDIVRAVPSVTGFTSPVDLWHRASKWLASQVGPSAPGVAGGVAGTVAGPTLTSIPVAGAAAGGVDVARQALGNAMLKDSPIGDIDYLNAGGQALMAAAGQGLGVALTRNPAVRQNPLEVSPYDRRVAMDPATYTTAAANRQAAQDVGVDLSFGQATGLRSARAAERQLARDPVSADIMDQFYRNQRNQLTNASGRFIDSISPVQSVDEGVNAMRTGAGAAVEGAKEARRAVAKPAYDAVMRPDNLMPRAEFNALMGNDTILANALQTVRKDPVLSASVENMPDAALPVLDLVKRNLDDAYEVAKRAGENNKARIINDARDRLVGALDANFQGYDAARAAFAGASPEVAMLEKGAVGKLAATEGTEKIGEIRTLFNANLSNPAAVGKARAAYERAGTLDDWNAGLGTYLRDAVNTASKNSEGVSPQRLVSAVYGTQQQKDLLKAAMTPDQFEGFTRLMHVVQNAAKTLPEGSATATDAAGGAALRNQFGGAARLLGALTSPLRMADAGAQVGEKMALRMSDAGMEKLARAVTDPANVESLKKLRMLSPNSEKAVIAASQLLGVTGVTATGVRDPSGKPPAQ